MSKTPMADKLMKKYAEMNKIREDYIQSVINPPMVAMSDSCGASKEAYGFQLHRPTSLVCTTTDSTHTLTTCAPINKNKEQSMYLSINTTDNLEAQQKNYFGNRAVEIYSAKKDELKKTFGLINDASPKSPKEFAERIAAGKFEIKNADKDISDNDYFHWTNALVWRDPAVKEDKDGYKAAKELLNKKLDETKDIIVAAEKATDALEAVKALETATFH